MSSPIIEREWKGEGKNPDPKRFKVARILMATTQVARAAETEDLLLPFDDDGRMDWTAMAGLAVKLRKMLDVAYKNQGHVTVRFLGDLKSSTYPVDVEFFHLGANVTENEFSEMLRRAIQGSEKEEVVFINLANVRDIKVHVGNAQVSGLNADLACLSAFCDALEAWASDNATIHLVNA